jgi:hypothetical protein
LFENCFSRTYRSDYRATPEKRGIAGFFRLFGIAAFDFQRISYASNPFECNGRTDESFGAESVKAESTRGNNGERKMENGKWKHFLHFPFSIDYARASAF